MEDSRDSANTPSSSGAHLVKRGRTKNVVDNHGNNDNYSQARGNDNYYTAAIDDPPPDYSNVSTHYYGDDCPGGHLDDTAPFDVAAFLDYLDFHDNYGDHI